MIGAEPRTEWLHGTLARDEHGFVLTGEEEDVGVAARAPGVRRGDVRGGSGKRVTTAMGEGPPWFTRCTGISSRWTQ
jgi:thioredoxin reductase (NADPH)